MLAFGSSAHQPRRPHVHRVGPDGRIEHRADYGGPPASSSRPALPIDGEPLSYGRVSERKLRRELRRRLRY
jgi:hypothetical protein